jgi:hypothetical protein
MEPNYIQRMLNNLSLLAALAVALASLCVTASAETTFVSPTTITCTNLTVTNTTKCTHAANGCSVEGSCIFDCAVDATTGTVTYALKSCAETSAVCGDTCNGTEVEAFVGPADITCPANSNWCLFTPSNAGTSYTKHPDGSIDYKIFMGGTNATCDVQCSPSGTPMSAHLHLACLVGMVTMFVWTLCS